MAGSAGAQQSPSGAWDGPYLTEDPSFNTEANAFLVDVAGDLESGRALDVGMGQGRNALHLARQGWSVSGFDVSRAGVSQALEAAAEQELEIDAVVQSSQEYDWGVERWDLIVLAYFPFLRPALPSILAGLRPGGAVVVEAYHADSALDRPPGPGAGVTFATNELLRLFTDLRVIQYQDLRAKADWGLFETRLVRLFARKQA